MDELFRVFTIRDGKVIEGAEGEDINVYHKGDNQRVLFVIVVTGSYGGCKLPKGNESATINSVVVVIDVGLGMLGGILESSYDHDNTGDRIGWKCQRMSCGFFKNDIMEKPDQCPECGAGSKTAEAKPPAFVFGEFPEEIEVLRRVFSIMPNGRKRKLMVAVVPRNVVFRVIHSVTESGDFQAKYYKWDGKKFHTATETERNFLKDF